MKVKLIKHTHTHTLSKKEPENVILFLASEMLWVQSKPLRKEKNEQKP